jgi:hypothetical protein
MVTVITVTAQVTVTAETFSVPTATSAAVSIAQTVTLETGCKTTVTALAHTTVMLDLFHLTVTAIATAHVETDRNNHGIFIHNISNFELHIC